MNILKGVSIRNQLYIAFACMLGIMIFFAIVRGQQLNTVMDRYSEAMTSINMRQQYIGASITAINRLRFEDMALGLLWDSAEFEEQIALSNRAAYIKSFQHYLASHRNLVLHDLILTEETKASQLEILDYVYYALEHQYIPTFDGIVAALEQGDRAQFVAAMDKNFSVGAYLQDLIWELRDETFAFTVYITQTMGYYDGVDERMFNILTIAGLSIAVLLAIVLAQTIQRPISKLRHAVSEFASGNLDYPIRMKYTDDIGHLSHDVANMVESITKMLTVATAQKDQILKQEQQELYIQHELEKSQLMYEAKSEFIANISHEIRTPMNSIIGYAELALENEMPEQTREYILNVLSNAKWLLKIINDVMDFSKIESGNLVLEEVPFGINEIAEHCRSILLPVAKNKGVSLRFDIENIITRRITGDPTKLNQILINLLSNAIKFTHNGHASLDVSMVDSTEDAYILKFEVIDTGIGMTEAQVAKIFAPYTQADPSTSRKYGGTGLGLVIAKRLIEAMGGELLVDSVKDKGSSFSFTLRFDIMEESSFVVFLENQDVQISKPHFDRGDILIVEDNAMNIGVAVAHLQGVGLRCTIARNGVEAVKLVRRRMDAGRASFDLILMDIHMPEMDGKEAAAIISKMDIASPIVAMTADVITVVEEVTYESVGIEGYICKPFTAQELWRCLLKHLG